MVEQRIFPPHRPTKKFLLTLPQDQLDMIDDGAKAVGLSRSAFLQIYFDVFAERLREFVEGWLTGVSPYVQKLMEQKKKR